MCELVGVKFYPLSPVGVKLYPLSPGHGVCSCGKCWCRHGYVGKACECTDAVDNCLAAGSGVSDVIQAFPQT
jgi:hypothetical protein